LLFNLFLGHHGFRFIFLEEGFFNADAAYVDFTIADEGAATDCVGFPGWEVSVELALEIDLAIYCTLMLA